MCSGMGLADIRNPIRISLSKGQMTNGINGEAQHVHLFGGIGDEAIVFGGLPWADRTHDEVVVLL